MWKIVVNATHLGEVNKYKKAIKDPQQVPDLLTGAIAGISLPARWRKVMLRSFQRNALNALKHVREPFVG